MHCLTWCPFGAGFNRSLQSVCARWLRGLSDYGRCAFGSDVAMNGPTLLPPCVYPSDYTGRPGGGQRAAGPLAALATGADGAG